MTRLHVVLSDNSQEVDVVIGMKAGHLLTADGLWSENFHLTIEAVVHDEVVRHAHTVRFHGMSWSVVVVADFSC